MKKKRRRRARKKALGMPDRKKGSRGDGFGYFDEDLEEDDYYEGEGSEAGHWRENAECGAAVRADGEESGYFDEEEDDDYAEPAASEGNMGERGRNGDCFHEIAGGRGGSGHTGAGTAYEAGRKEGKEGREKAGRGKREGYRKKRRRRADKPEREKRDWNRKGHVDAMGIASAFFGILIAAAAASAVYFSVNAKMEEAQVAAFAEVGTGMEGIEVVGESGLLAMMDAQNRKAAAAEAEAVEEASAVPEYEEKELQDEGLIPVEMHLSSMQKDLKIKFVNKETGKLIPNVPFEVTVEDAGGKSHVLKDEDMDGILYLADVTPGTCRAAMKEVDTAGEYSISAESVTVRVKEAIEYKKVDVADEIKKESEVDTAAEDTKRAAATESALPDTVGFVESTREPAKEPAKEVAEEPEEEITAAGADTAGKEEYEEIPKEYVAAPAMAAGDGGNQESGSQEKDGNQANGDSQSNGGGQEGGAAEGSPAVVLNKAEVKLALGKTLQLTAEVKGLEDKSVTWISENAGVAAVAGDGMVTGAGTGTAAVMAVCNGDNSLTAVCTVTVSAETEADSNTKLTDREGKQLYVTDAEGNFREAVYADYGTAEKFYRKKQENQAGQPEGPAAGEPKEGNGEEEKEEPKEEPEEGTGEEFKYTGWQTIGGKTYYFDAQGNKVTGEQVIQGARYTFDSEGALSAASGNMGIDVSKWNGSIDWNAVKNSGVSYVIIRCGYRGSTTGALIEDSMFRSNIQGASSVGLKVGVYFVTQAVNEVEAVEEASMVVSLLSGCHISYPVFLDVEPSGGRGDGIDKAARTAVCRAFCQTIQNSGYTAGIYANHTWLNEKIDTPSLADYKIWLAQYRAEPSYTATRYDLWQYSAKGTVAGISGETDLNISYLGY